METYLPILHLPRVESRSKLQEKLLEDQEQTGALDPAWLPPSSTYARDRGAGGGGGARGGQAPPLFAADAVSNGVPRP